MINFSYTFTAVEPISHFSDERNGNVQTFRRHKVCLPKAVEIPSLFADKRKRTEAIVEIIYAIKAHFQRKVEYGGWEEFQDKIKAYSNSKTANEFVNRLMQSFDCRPILTPQFHELLDMFDDKEFLDTIRDEYRLIVARVNLRNQQEYERYANEKENKKSENSLFYTPKDIVIDKEVKSTIVKYTDNVPFVCGNAIRGRLRNIVFKDYCDLAGIGTPENKLSKEVFHQFFTGGVIDQPTAELNLEFRKNYIYHCPMIGLLGTAIGNGTMEGQLIVENARLKCTENRNGDMSYWECMNLEYNTRVDDSRKESDIEYETTYVSESEAKNQMIWFREEVCAGAVFEHAFCMEDTMNNPILESAFYRLLWLFAQHPYIGGNIARGCGRIELNLPEGFTIDELESRSMHYVRHVQEIAPRIPAFFDEMNQKTTGKAKEKKGKV